MLARFKFAKEQLNKPNEFWTNVGILLFDESKIELHDYQSARHVWRVNGTAYDQNNECEEIWIDSVTFKTALGQVKLGQVW